VPEGEWLLLGWREDPHPLTKHTGAGRDAANFADRPVTVGYTAISYWRMRVSVHPGEVTSVDLTDRSVWLTAVREWLVERGGTGKLPAKRRR
jgi:hypothetical protein